MIIGAQLYTLRDYCKTPEDTYETLKKVAAMGYTAVQMSGVGKIEYPLFKQYCDEFGLDIICSHNGFDRIVNDTEQLIKDHDDMDCKYIGIGAPTPDQWDNVEHFKAFIDALAEASEKIHAAGKVFCYHNHNIEFEPIPGTEDFIGMDYILEKFPEHVQFIVDTFWVEYAGTAPADHLKRLAGRIDCVHYKDLIERPKKDGEEGETEKVYAEVGTGVLDWPSINKACEEGGTKWIIVEQDVCETDPFECLQTSYNNIKAMGYC